MTVTTEIEPLSVWWADVKLEMSIDGEFYISRESFERPVLIIDNKAYLVFKITSRLGGEGYRIRDLSVAGLPRESVIRTDILVPISVSDLRYKMGVLSRADRIGLKSYMENRDSPRIMGQKRRFRSPFNIIRTLESSSRLTIPEGRGHNRYQLWPFYRRRWTDCWSWRTGARDELRTLLEIVFLHSMQSIAHVRQQKQRVFSPIAVRDSRTGSP